MTKYRPAPAYSQDESKLGRCAVETPGPSVDAFACNQTRLLLAVFGYQIMHAQRAVLERATGTGWRPAAVAGAGAARAGPVHRLRPQDRHDRQLGLVPLAAPSPAPTRRVAACLFRRSRPPIPSEAVHVFRSKPSTHSERSRPGWSGDPEGVLDTE